MEARDASRLEFIKQPHIVTLIVLLIICLIGALVMAGRRVNQTIQLANMETFEACNKLVQDEPLCKFAAQDLATVDASYVLSIAKTAETEEEITIISAENSKKTSSITKLNGEITDETIIIDNSVYIKDYTDNTWAHFTEDAANTEEETTYNFTSENSEDVKAFRNDYKYESMEKCGDKTCYKYKISHGVETDSYSYLWFDDEEFVTRRMLAITPEYSTNMAFEYKSVIINAPSPTKEISQEDLEKFIAEDDEL